MIRKQEEVVFVGAARTPVGAFLGDLRTVPVEDLGEIALKEAVSRANLTVDKIDEVVLGHVTGSQTTNNLGNIIGINSGLSERATGMTINRICGSGIQSSISAALELLHSNKNIIAAGGAESLSRAPFQLPDSVRYQPLKLGDSKIIDSNLAGHWSASGRDSGVHHMGNTAENIARKYNITRERADLFAVESQRKAAIAMESGRFSEEIVPVEVKLSKGKINIVKEDGHPRPGTTLESLSKLKPAFEKDGIVTAGNASGLNDGAAFEIMTTKTYAEKNKLDIMGKVVDYQVSGCKPSEMGLGPVVAIKELLDRQELDLIKDIDILEINEAFAAQTIGCLIELGIEEDSDFYKNNFNPNGGAVALGHPLGMSGARIITSLLYEFKQHPDKRYGIASACIGGGQGIALLLENGYYSN